MTDTLPNPSNGAVHTNPATGQRMVYSDAEQSWKVESLVKTSGDQMSGGISFPDMRIGPDEQTVTASDNAGDPPAIPDAQPLEFDFEDWNLINDAGCYGGWTFIAHGDGTFISTELTGSGRYITSEDGLNWTKRLTMPPGAAVFSIAHGGGKWMIGDLQGNGYWSTNGQTWNQGNFELSYAGGLYSLAYGNGIWVAGTFSGAIHYSSDGKNWKGDYVPIFTSQNAAVYGIAYGDGKFVAVGDRGLVAYSPDGVTWSAGSNADKSGSMLWEVVYGDGKFVAVSAEPNYGNDGIILYSNDGINWFKANLNLTETSKFMGVAYGGGHFCAPTRTTSSGVVYSSDGINWEEGQLALRRNAQKGIAYGNGTFVAVSDQGQERLQVTGSLSGGGGSAGPNGGSGVFYDGKEIQVDRGQRSALVTTSNSVIKRVGNVRYYLDESPVDSNGMVEDGSLWLNPETAKIHIYHDSDWNQLN